jgi:uncharacterized damage-inducible protein DinB
MPSLARIGFHFVVAAVLLAPSAAAAGPLTDQERDVALKHLAETRQKFLDSIATLTDAQWTFKAGADRWSIAEVAEHIAISESTILQLIREKIMSAPAAPPDAARPPDEKVIASVADRSERFQAPEFLRPTNRWSTRDALEKDFIAARQVTVEYVKTTTDDMRAHAAPHPVLKTLDAYQWLLLLSAHTARHTAQIEEVKTSAGYPK